MKLNAKSLIIEILKCSMAGSACMCVYKLASKLLGPKEEPVIFSRIVDDSELEEVKEDKE